MPFPIADIQTSQFLYIYAFKDADDARVAGRELHVCKCIVKSCLNVCTIFVTDLSLDSTGGLTGIAHLIMGVGI